MSKVDWSLAPEWCNCHGYIGNTEFQVWFDAFSYQYVKSGKRYQFEEYENYALADICRITERKKLAAWSGQQDGLPPVNTVCNYMRNYKREGSEYVKARVLHHDGGSVIVRILEGDGKGSLKESRGGDCGGHSIFLAIKTPEQLAAEQRETAIREFMDIVGTDCRVTAGKAVDAGFKREVV